MIDAPQALHVAVVGPGATRARDILGGLAQAGYHARGFLRFTRLLESKREWGVTLLLVNPGKAYAEADEAALADLACARPLIVVSPHLDMEIVRLAASLGAHDVVLRGDLPRLLESLERAQSAFPQSENALTVNDRDAITRNILDLTPNHVSIRGADGRLVMVSQTFADHYGTTVEDMLGKSIVAYAHSPEEAHRECAEDAEVLRTRRSSAGLRESIDSDGRRRLLQVVKRPIFLDDGRAFVMSVGVDVTKPLQAESALEKTSEFLKNVLETISGAVFALDLSGKFTLSNRGLSQMTGYKPHEISGMPFARIFAPESAAEVERVLASFAPSGKEKRFEAQLARPDGQQRTLRCALVALRQNGSTIGYVGTADDITERKNAEQRVEHLAYHDALTNLPNRRLLNDRLSMAMSQAERDGRMVAVLFLDLDRFKGINDSLGHRSGDTLLQELAARLRASVRSGDTVARMGGDEFIFVLPAIGHVEEAVHVARKMLDGIRAPFTIGGREFVVTACVGIALYPAHAQDAETLIKQADTALFECKRRGSDTFAIFDASMSARSMDHFVLENELRRAISHSELRLMYQPIVEMRTERIVALEALVRWLHPERGMLMPDQFIRLAEETGLIVPLGDWVLREACRQNREWQRRGLFMVPVAVNISARQFDDDLGASVSEALDASALPAHFLDLELTESILMENAAASPLIVDGLKELGVHISVDDFGTGYSSLSYLERFPIDALKIDRSFMPAEPLAPGAGVIAATIISMAQSLGLYVIAEGVETREQRDFLLDRGCSRAQGHYYWPAMMPGALERLASSDTRNGVFP